MKMLNWFLILTFFTVTLCFSQENIVRIDKIPTKGMLLNKGWRFQTGDNPAYAKNEYDDRTWQSINPALNIPESLPQIPKIGICWFRLHILVDSSISRQLSIMIYQSGASEIYLDGLQIMHFGVLSADPKEIKAYDPFGKPVLLPINNGAEHVLAIRYALQPQIRYSVFSGDGNPALMIRLNTTETSDQQFYKAHSASDALEVFRIGAFFILFILHLAFYLFYPAQKANLYFSLYALFLGSCQIISHETYFANEVALKFYYNNLVLDLEKIGQLFMLTAIYILLLKKRKWRFWLLTSLLTIAILLNAFTYAVGIVISIFILPWLISLEIGRIAFESVGMKKRGAWILLGGAIGFLVSSIVQFIGMVFYFDVGYTSIFSIVNFTYNFASLSIPVATSIYLGLDFAFTNRSLKQKLSEVEELSQKTIAQEKEKQQILATQNEILESQVIDRTAALSKSLNELKATQSQLIQSEKMASLGELTAGIAHEIQNPLNFVNNFSEVNVELLNELKDGPLQQLPENEKKEAAGIVEDLSQNLEKISIHGKRADAIVKGMLLHSRISTGQKELVDINALADEYLRLSFHGFRAKDKSFNAKLNTDFDGSIEKIDIIPQDIGRVLLNLYNNAFYAVNEKIKQQLQGYEPEVTVITKKAEDKIEIKVRDNGVGIPHKVIDKIFQPFFTTKPTGQGTGLGLSLSYDIVKAYGGEIKVETREEAFTDFMVQLPISS
jgi:two-component system NtrC family sensor kinase